MDNANPNPSPRYRTRYEVVARHPEHGEVVLGFTPRTSRNGLLKVMQARGTELIEHFRIAEADEVSFHTKPRVHATFTGGLVVTFTGRTELEASRNT